MKCNKGIKIRILIENVSICESIFEVNFTIYRKELTINHTLESNNNKENGNK